MTGSIQQYLRQVQRECSTGKATEHTYRAALQSLIESAAKGIHAINEPKRVACGAPDFVVTRGQNPVGFVECKDIGVPLDDEEKSDQLKRYFGSLENLILTDYLEFRYYVAGQRRMQVPLAAVDTKGKVRLMQGADAQLLSLLDSFLSAEPVRINTPRELAARLAGIAKVVRNAIERAFEQEDAGGTLHGELESFRQTILGDITPTKFADMYAQTVCYGMFSARVNVPDQDADRFTREHAAYDLPKTNPFLREVFEYVAGTKLDESVVWAVDLLAETLRRCDMGEILKDFGKATRREDPVVHFYETFLAAYDPALRESRGVYYTPEPVVHYIVRSIDHILKKDFGCPAGLADSSKVQVSVPDPTAKGGKAVQEVHRVQILDPAAGTGTFLYQVIRHIYDSLSPNRGLWAGRKGYVAQHLLPRLYGFELMMAPYAVAHLKLSLLLQQTGYDFPGADRLQVYLTNTLEQAEIVAGPLLAYAQQIAREANAASRVKTQCPIMVVLGNPPYSGHSQNKGKWIEELIEDYKRIKGKKIKLGQAKWIHNDYVKFIRFAQHRIEKTGYGVLAMITDHSYIDSGTFVGMRANLLEAFDEIYVLNLEGNSKRNQNRTDLDENVFDITQGTAILLAIKTGRSRGHTEVFAAEVRGARKQKYEYLSREAITTTRWKRVNCEPPYYLFTSREAGEMAEYSSFVPLDGLLPGSYKSESSKRIGTGFVTTHDSFAIGFEPGEVENNVRRLLRTRTEEEARNLFRLCSQSQWVYDVARRRLSGIPWKDSLRSVLYRPFDTRFTIWDRSVCVHRRVDVHDHAKDGNRLLCVGQAGNVVGAEEWALIFVSDAPVDFNCFYRGGCAVLPLYLYPEKGKIIEGGHWPPGKRGRRPNLSPDFVKTFSGRLGMQFVSDGMGDMRRTFGPDDVFHYAYAVFHCPMYRKRYAEFLQIDFPRLPLTSDRRLFARLCGLGAELVGLHLLESVPPPAATFPAAGDSIVDKVWYKPPTAEAPGRVYINKTQYFQDVAEDVWAFHVGGYQVCEKWLKDRRGRTLSSDEIEHYLRITEAIRQTIRLMGEIDKAIPRWPIE